jgi:hypothetical protein
MLPVYLADDADKKRVISERMKFPSFQVLNFKYTEQKSIIPSLEERLNINFENNLTQMGTTGYFLPVNFTNRTDSRPYNMRSRKTDIFIKRPSSEIDTIVYELPASLKPERLPSPISIKNQFGEYKAQVEYANNQLKYIRSFQLNKGKYPASEYTNFVDYFDEIASADAIKCVLVKK